MKPSKGIFIYEHGEGGHLQHYPSSESSSTACHNDCGCVTGKEQQLTMTDARSRELENAKGVVGALYEAYSGARDAWQRGGWVIQ